MKRLALGSNTSNNISMSLQNGKLIAMGHDCLGYLYKLECIV